MLDQQTRERLVAMRKAHLAKGARRAGLNGAGFSIAHLHKARVAASAARRAQGEATLRAILEQAARGATMEEAADAIGMTVYGVRRSLERRLGSRVWPPKINNGENSNGL